MVVLPSNRDLKNTTLSSLTGTDPERRPRVRARTCLICFQLLPVGDADDVAHGDAGVQPRGVRRLGFVDVVAVADGEDVGESFHLQVLVDLQRAAFGHVIGCGGTRRTDRITQSAPQVTACLHGVDIRGSS